MKIRYEVTAQCQNLEVQARFIDWMRLEHADDLLRIDGCEECRVLRVDDSVVRNEYIFASDELLKRYLSDEAPTLRQKVRQAFGEGEVSFARSQAQLVFAKLRGE